MTTKKEKRTFNFQINVHLKETNNGYLVYIDDRDRNNNYYGSDEMFVSKDFEDIIQITDKQMEILYNKNIALLINKIGPKDEQ